MILSDGFYAQNSDGDTLEVCLILFKKCNLDCQFCFQDRSESVNVEYIRSIPLRIEPDLVRLV